MQPEGVSQRTALESALESFLAEYKLRRWTGAVDLSWANPLGYYSPAATNEVEVALARANAKPTISEVRQLWSTRHAGRATGVFLVLMYPSSDGPRAMVAGLYDAAQVLDVELDALERRLVQVLDAESRREIEDLLTELFQREADDGNDGLRNQGLFADHALFKNTPVRLAAQWATATEKAKRARDARGADLLAALDWTVTHKGSDLLLQPAGTEHGRAIAVLLEADEVFDRPTLRYGLGTSPVEHGLEIARHHGVPWLLVLRGSTVRLYSANPNGSVARSGTSSFTEVVVDLLDDDHAAFAWFLLSPEALAPGGAVDGILKDSREHAASLGERLRERIYVDVVPALAQTIATRLGDSSDAGLASAYHHTLVVLFRLLFVAYAEDRDLLPYDVPTSAGRAYHRVALKTRAIDYAEQMADGSTPRYDNHARDVWNDLTSIWQAVYRGHEGWGVPAYGGSLFREDSPSGLVLNGLSLTNSEIEPALVALLVDHGVDGPVGPVDFQALSVREFGTIYEGLLESSLSLAPVDLTLDDDSTYVPAADGDEVVVAAGDVYFHNASGARKSTGSYFTKEFAVEHLLRTALVPTLREHLERVQALVDSGKDADAAEAFFDFRVADLAMGSGHFLVAAVDQIASHLSGFLDRAKLPAITGELDRMREIALTNLAAVSVTGADAPEITHEALLRRQVARRCIYGLDINEIAVDLARLALWIHTFVPGLPMSSLGHGLVHGNSLTGIATIDELLGVIEPDTKQADLGVQSFFTEEIDEKIAATDKPLSRIQLLSEVTVAETEEAERLQREASEIVQEIAHAMDAVAASRLGAEDERIRKGTIQDARQLAATGWEALVAAGAGSAVQEALADLNPVHFPVAYPEAFRPGRERPGFDVVLGNPPWDKVRWEEIPFWTAVRPGLTAMSDSQRAAELERLRSSHPVEAADENHRRGQREAEVRIYKSAYTLRGSSHLEYAQLMLERALRVVRPGGRLGLVLPRQLTVLAGWKNLREAMFASHEVDVVQARNRNEWLFDGIHASYAVVMLTLGHSQKRTDAATRISVAQSPQDVLRHDETNVVLPAPEIEALSDSWAVPWLNDPGDIEIFNRMKNAPALSSGRGWITGRHDARWDFRGSGPDKGLVNAVTANSVWRVFMTRHIDAFALDLGEKFNKTIDGHLPAAVAKKRGLAFDEKGIAHLSVEHPLVVFRHPSRSDDTRTLIVAALPDSGFVHNKGYVHSVAAAKDTTAKEQLALLGYMNTLVADWWTRRFVDRHVTAPIINFLRLPEWDELQIASAALITETLLARNGYSRLAGGHVVEDSHVGVSDIELQAELEELALAGFGLDREAMLRIVADFSEKGAPKELLAVLGVTRRSTVD